MVIFRNDIFDQDTNELVWRKNKFYAVKRGNTSQMLLENETEKEYGLDPHDIGTFCEVVDCDGEPDLKCTNCDYCTENNGAIHCTVRKFAKGKRLE